jgi:hypothetical protein
MNTRPVARDKNMTDGHKSTLYMVVRVPIDKVLGDLSPVGYRYPIGTMCILFSVVFTSSTL